jgi:ankyrin repeat protein
MNQTPLMAAAAAGNIALVEALLERGADRDAVDHYVLICTEFGPGICIEY